MHVTTTATLLTAPGSKLTTTLLAAAHCKTYKTQEQRNITINMYFESQIYTGWLQGQLGEVLRVKTKAWEYGPFKQARGKHEIHSIP